MDTFSLSTTSSPDFHRPATHPTMVVTSHDLPTHGSPREKDKVSKSNMCEGFFCLRRPRSWWRRGSVSMPGWFRPVMTSWDNWWHLGIVLGKTCVFRYLVIGLITQSYQLRHNRWLRPHTRLWFLCIHIAVAYESTILGYDPLMAIMKAW